MKTDKDSIADLIQLLGNRKASMTFSFRMTFEKMLMLMRGEPIEVDIRGFHIQLKRLKEKEE